MQIKFSSGDIRRFAEWSGDHNPLHVDPAAARRTFFGQPLVHGMYSVIRALGALDAPEMRPLRTLDVEFRGAVFPEADYEVSSTRDASGVSLTLRSADSSVLIMRGGFGSDSELGTRPSTQLGTTLSLSKGREAGARESGLGNARPNRQTPAVLDVDDLRAGLEISGRFDTGADAAPYASRALPAQHARVLGLCSYVIGMEAPGLRSLFTRATITFTSNAGEPLDPAESTSLLYRARVVRFDRQFRMLDIELNVSSASGETIATAALRSYVRFSPILTSLDDLTQRLGSSASRLRKKVAVVVGGTRGLGGDITAALAVAGCHVFATYRSDKDATGELETRLRKRGLDVTFLQGDAANQEWCAQTLDEIRRRHGRVDLLVLNACAPPSVSRVASTGSNEFDQYLSQNLRLVRTPLAAFLPSIEESRGAVVTISSSFVEDPPAGFGAYVALKQAVEGLVHTASREFQQVYWLTPRPPRLQTAWNDTPTGVLGAIPADWVASHIVNRLGDSWSPGRRELLTEFPEFAATPATTTGDPDFTVMLSATFTAEPVANGLRFWFGEHDVAADVDVAPYGQVLQTLLNPSATAPTRGLNAVLLRVRDWLRELAPDQASSPEFVSQYLQQTAHDLERAMRAHRAQAPAETLLLLCPSGTTAAPGIDAVVQRTESWIAQSLSGLPGVELVVASDLHSDYNVQPDEIDDALRERIAHIPYRNSYIYVLSTIVMRHVHRKRAPIRKVVVLDCDNTLWRGVVGEVGAEGIDFDASHRALHRRLVELGANGILVCLCSKNEEEDVWRVFDTRTDLLLPRDRVVAAAINWQPKSQNLRALATRLNVGLESFVFLDDNPVECAEVRANCPEVLTLQWPTDIVDALYLLRHAWELQPRKGTSEDARRTEMYREEFKRQELLEGTLSFRDFVNSLDLVVDVRPLDAADLKRASQLTLRTNQFNFTTRRRGEAEMQSLLGDERTAIRTVRVRDRFGDYGLVGLLIAQPGEDLLTVDTFLLSCRVLGRGVEHHMAAETGRIATAAGLRGVKMRIEPTKRNTPARKFLEAIAPPEYRTVSDGVVDCEFPSEWLSNLRFEPGEQPAETYADAEHAQPSGTGSQLDSSRLRLRAREDQIARAAQMLRDPSLLAAAIDGKSVVAPAPAATTGDAGAVICEAFAAALNMPAARVRDLDRLEALGCDSFKIVEITVALIEKYPWLPATLLFEHRSVSDIITEVNGLLAKKTTPAALSVSAPSASPVAERGDDEIAVVGMHVRCAGARSPEELWALLRDGATAVVPVPEDRRHFLRRLEDTRPHWAGLIDDVDRFDAELFGVAPREAEVMDPQLRLFLEVAWAALEDGGCLGSGHDISTGVFVGVMYGDYGFLANSAAQERGTPYRCWEGFSLANRLSQLLGFRGPSLAVDTACSSSGTALHLAARALSAGDCNIAVVGGVNLILDPDRFVHLGRLGILSNVGRCLAFGSEADGTVLGEGAGAVVLRRLSDARRRGDRILGVIKGTAVSTGSGTVGFTAPNPVAQSEAIRRALHTTGIDPRTISYVETHGTGTSLGDPIEVRGLTLAHATPELLDVSLEGTSQCGLGSIKPNIGHLEAGAGVLGLVKVLLQLQHGELLPSLTSPDPNPQIPFDQTPFYIQRALAPWKRPLLARNGQSTEFPRRAGLSSFGVGGSNAHVIVEEAPASPVRQSDMERPTHILALSAQSRDALRARARDLIAWFDDSPDVSIADAFHSANTGRRHLQHRRTVIASSREQALEQFRQIADGRQKTTADPGSGARPKIAFLFTGQGSQYAPMGRDLYDTQAVFRESLDRCAAIFDTLLDRPLLQLLFAEAGSADAQLLNQTGYTQPALFAFEYALAQMWMSWGIRPDVVMGHSVGEIAAMCVAGGVSLDDGLKLIAARGRLMQALPAGGAMTSVMADEARVARAIAGHENDVSLAAINGPTQTVISGAGAVVSAIADRFAAEGVKTRALTVSHAFHSPLMKPIAADYAAVVKEIAFTTPRVPLVTGVHGRAAGDEITRPEYWISNALEPVRFADGISALYAQGTTAFLEIGPQPVLTAMGRQCLSDEAGTLWLGSLRKDAPAWPTLLESLGELYVAGADIDWDGFDAPYLRRRVTVPAYPFGGRRYWISQGSAIERAARERTSGAETIEAATKAYEVVWKSVPPMMSAAAASGDWIVLADATGFGATLVSTLEGLGGRCTVVFAGDQFVDAGQRRYQINPSSMADLGRVFGTGGAVRGIINLWPLDAASDTSTASEAHRLTEHAVMVVKQLLRSFERAGSARIWFVTKNATPAGSVTSALSLAQAPLWGLGRTIALEHPEAWGGLIDVASQPGPEEAAAVVAQLVSNGEEDQVALRGNARFVPRLVAAPEAPAREIRFSARAAYLITGAFGAIGRRVAQWAVQRGARHLVITSRRGSAAPEAAELVRNLESRGANVRTIAADVTRAADVDAIFAELASDGRPLGGIFHVAGLDVPQPLTALDSEQLRAVLEPKVDAAWMLHERSRAANPEHFVCFSSIASVLGSASRSHYAAANAFLDGLAFERKRLGLPALTVNWGPWSGGGMANEETRRQFERIGNYALGPDEALRQLEGLMQADRVQVCVARIDWAKFRLAYEARGPKPLISQISGDAIAVASTTPADRPAWISTLAHVPNAQLQRELAGLLQREVADTLGLEGPDSVPLDRTFQDMGMDSLMSAEFARRLQSLLGIRSTALVFQHPTAGALARALIEQVQTAIAGADRPDAAAIESGVAVSRGPSAPQGELAAPPAPLAPIEGYSPDTESLVFAFQEQAWPKRRRDWIAPRWRWMFVESAERLGIPPRVWLYRDNGRVVGHNGAIPIRLKIDQQEHDTAWLVDTMVLEEFRTKAVGSQLMVQSDQDLPFALSLGQTTQMREIQLRLGWEQVAPLQTAQLLIRPERVLKGKMPSPAAAAAGLGLRAASALRSVLKARPKVQVREVERFDDRHDHLWAQMARTIPCAVKRDASYMNWKYVNQPGQDFLRLEVMDGTEVRAVAIWVMREPDHAYAYRRAFLIDLVSPLDNAERLAEAIEATVAIVSERGADSAVCLHIGEPLTRALRQCSFHLREPGRYLLVSPGPLDDASRASVLSASNWFVTQGDSDIDRPW